MRSTPQMSCRPHCSSRGTNRRVDHYQGRPRTQSCHSCACAGTRRSLPLPGAVPRSGLHQAPTDSIILPCAAHCAGGLDPTATPYGPLQRRKPTTRAAQESNLAAAVPARLSCRSPPLPGTGSTHGSTSCPSPAPQHAARCAGGAQPGPAPGAGRARAATASAAARKRRP